MRGEYSIVEESERSFEAWPQNWRAQALIQPPLIAPARQFTYPMAISGEEDALARGALRLMIYPAAGGTFLATCALGFVSKSLPTGLFACPNPEEFCAVAGGYAYIVNAARPESCTHLAMRPVVEVRVFAEQRLLLFVGFHRLAAWGESGLSWETDRLSSEGIRLGEAVGNELTGFGWNMHTDKDVPFTVDLKTGMHRGGGF